MIPIVGLLGVAAGPVLASWAKSLEAETATGWWLARWTDWPCVLVLALVAGVLVGAGATFGSPPLAWVIWGLAGAVLLVVDLKSKLLPARLVWPATAAIALVLSITAVVTGAWSDLLRAGLAALVATAVWVTLTLAVPAAFGLGDARLLAVGAGLLGWDSWTAVLAGQMLAFLIAAVFGLVQWGVAGDRQVPLGPGIVIGVVGAAALV